MKHFSTLSAFAVIALSSSQVMAQDLSVGAEASADTDEGAAAAVELDEEPVEDAPTEPEPAPQPVSNDDSSAGGGAADEAEVDGDSDHDQMVGRFAVGYLGRQTLHHGIAYTPVVAPIIGARYWINDMIGIDAGIGLNMLGGKATLTDADDVKAAGHNAFLLHVGVPLNLADSKHFSFQVVPEANVGLVGTGDQDADPDITLKSKGTFFNIGAKVGGEIHFGFMDIPQLSLQGNVGLYLQTEGVKDTFDDGTDVIEATNSYTSLGTTLGADPWDMFTSSVSALYYF
jgi:hypothetical protein